MRGWGDQLTKRQCGHVTITKTTISFAITTKAEDIKMKFSGNAHGES